MNLDPELARYVDLIPRGELGDISAARASVEAFARVAEPVDTSGLVVEDRMVPGPPADAEVAVRVYRPETQAEPAPTVLYIHGGGFVVGSVDLEHAQAAALGRALGAVVVSVEYRLAPEHPFPAGLEDCHAALSWLHGASVELGSDPSRIAVVGSSAGGGLAAAVSLLARDRGGPPIRFQYLGMPQLDDRLDSPSMRRFVDSPMWSRPLAAQSWDMYLPGRHDDVSGYAAPARATDLSRLPPAYVSVMENDPMRDEGIRYASRLLEAGVSTELHAFPGTWHGSRRFPAAVSSREVAEMVGVLGSALRRYAA